MQLTDDQSVSFRDHNTDLKWTESSYLSPAAPGLRRTGRQLSQFELTGMSLRHSR